MALLSLLWPALVRASSHLDSVRLKDGSVLKGEILRVENDDLVLDTDYADEVTIEVEYIAGIETSRQFTVRLLDGKKVTGYLAVTADGKLVIQGTPAPETVPHTAIIVPEDSRLKEAETAQPLPPDDRSVREEAVQRAVVSFADVDWIEQKPTYYRYEGAFNVGAQAARGNSDTTDLHFDAYLKPSFGWNAITFSGEYDRKEANGDTSTNRWETQASYERDIGRRWVADVLNSYERDKKMELDLRIVAGTGVSYKFFDEDPTHLKAGPAVGYVVEMFSGDSDGRSFPALLWTLDFTRDLYKDDISLYHNHRVIDSFETLGNFIVSTRTGFALELFGDLTLSTELQIDWNNEPAAGAKQQDTRYILKIGYEFEGDETDWWQ